MAGVIETDQPRFRRVTTLAEVDGIAAEWRDLETRCGDQLTYFQSFDWCRGWMASFADTIGGPEFRIKTVWRGDRLIAIWPLMVQSTGGVRVLQGLGAPHSQYCNVLYDAAFLDEGTVSELISRIVREPDCDVALFQPVPRQSPLAAMMTAPPMPIYDGRSAVLDLSGYASAEAYRLDGGKLKKRNRNRRRNHLARLGDLDFEMVWPEDPRFAGLVGECIAMKRIWLQETGRASSGFSFEGFERFLAGLAGDAASRSGAALSVLRTGEKVAAMELGFLKSEHYYAYLGSFDWSIRHLSPGKVQMEMTVCWLIENGVKSYDLMGGDGDYKQSWSNRDVALKGYSLPFSWKGWLYAEAWLNIARPLAKRIYWSVPEKMRRFATRFQALGLFIIAG